MTVAAVALLMVVFVQYISFQWTVDELRTRIEASLIKRGTNLTFTQALTLRSLAADNAIGDIQKIVKKTVAADSDIIYGAFVNSLGDPWAYVSPSTESGVSVKVAIQELRLTKKDLNQEKPQSKIIDIFGVNILDFSEPVFDDEQDFLGVVRYGLSTESMKKTQIKVAKSIVINTVALLCLILLSVVGAIFLGVIQSRRAASKIVAPITSLINAAEALADGDRTVRVDIQSNDEVEILGNTFNRMVEDLQITYANLEELNSNLEEKVAARTAELELRSCEMAVVLENVSQGLVTVDLKGRMSAERSKCFDDWLGIPSADTNFSDHIKQYDQSVGDCFSMGLEDLSEGVLPVEVSLRELPKRLQADSRELLLEYTPILGQEQKKITHLLITITNITERLNYEKSEAEQRESLAVFKEISKDKSGFLSFVNNTTETIEKICVAQEKREKNITVLKRFLHTVKGNAALFNLHSIASICHELENDIESTGAPESIRLSGLYRRWSKIRESAHELIVDERSGFLVEEYELDRLAMALREGISNDKAVDILSRWKLESVETILCRLGAKSINLAKRLGKYPIDIHIDGQGVRLHYQKYERFFSELIHVIQNAVDHGLEEMWERRARLKPTAGQLTLRVESNDKNFVVFVEDDGNGIDWATIGQKAYKMGLPSQSTHDLLMALFSDGMSTRDEVSETSGRGVGMSAIKDVCTDLGGIISIETKAGVGTSFAFTFPPLPAICQNPWSSASMAAARSA